MPFDYDPTGWYAQHAQAVLNPGLPQDQRPRNAGPMFPALPPEEEESALAKLTHGVLGGVGYIGSLLDKYTGGRAIRGLLGGKPEELASILPFSDALGITDEANAVSGSQLLGIKDPQNFGEHLPGIAAEIALNPFTFLSGPAAALTPLGKAAKAIKVLPKTTAGRIAGLAADSPAAQSLASHLAGSPGGQQILSQISSVAGKPLGGLSNFGVPFMGDFATLGTGPVGQQIAKYAGAAADKLRWSPVGRGFSAMFQQPVEGALTRTMQEANIAKNEALAPLQAGVREKIADWAQRLGEENLGPESSDAIRSILEGTSSAVPGTKLASVVPEIKDFLGSMPNQERSLGVLSQAMENYAPRGKTIYPGITTPSGRASMTPLDPFNPSLIQREEMFHGLPTADLNALAKDKAISGPTRTLKSDTLLPEADYIRKNYLGLGDKELQELQDLKANPPPSTMPSPHDPNIMQPHPDFQRMQELNRKFKQGEDLAGFTKQLDPKYSAGEGLDFFGNPLLQDVQTRGLRHVGTVARANTLHDVLAKSAVPASEAAENAVPLTDVLKNAGLGDTAGARTTAMERLVQAGKLQPGQAEDFLKMRVPKEIADDVSRSIKGFASPEATSGLLGAFDSMTNFTKVFQTVTWPARYARNYLQQLWGMFVGGHSEPGLAATNPKAWAKPQMDALNTVRMGKVVEDANKIPGLENLTPAEATKEMAKEMYAWKVVGPQNLKREADVVGMRTGYGTELGGGGKGFTAPGATQPNFLDLGNKTWNPLDLRGVAGRTETTFAPAKLGARTDEVIDEMTRGGSYFALRRQGLSPQAAAEEVKKIHYDYGNLSQTEKSVLRRVMPFYSWTRQNLPAQMEQILAQPGGKTATAIRVANSMRQGEKFTPEDIAQELAIPIGGEKEGQQRFVSRLGLPFEDAFSYLQGGRNAQQNLARSAQEFLSQMNPLIKGPLEVATGKQFFSGRDLADLNEPTGVLPKNILLDQALMNSPLARFATTGRKIFFDPRKGWGDAALTLGSPVTIHDVDMMKRRDIAAREYITDILRGQEGVRVFQRPSVKAEDLGKLSPQEIELLRLQTSIEQRAREQAKAAR